MGVGREREIHEDVKCLQTINSRNIFAHPLSIVAAAAAAAALSRSSDDFWFIT
jgi:hypothetical protein